MNTYTQNITDTPPTSDTLDTPSTPSLSEASSTPEKLSGEAAWDYGDTFELISKVAYLIGVPRRIFENENEPPKMEVFRRLELDKAARIIRHLCILRTAIERNFKAINEAMRMDFRTLYSMPELVPSESLRQLSEDGASFVKRSSFIYYTREALESARADLELLARTEGLTAHAGAVSIRFEEE